MRDNDFKSLVWFILGNSLLLLGVFAAVVFQIVENRKEIIEKTKVQALNTAMITEEAVLASLKAIDIVTDQIVYESKKRDNLTKLTEEDRTHLLHNMGMVKGVLLTWVDENGNPLGDEFNIKDHLGARFNYSDRDYFKFLKKAPVGSKFITQPIKGKSTGQWVMVTAKRLSSKTGKFKGVVMVAITQSFFESIRKKINTEGNNTFTVAVGEHPNYFYRFPDTPKIIGTPMIPNPNASEVVRRQLHSAVYETQSPIDGMSRIAAHSWVGDEPILIIFGFDLATVLSSWSRQSILTVSISLAGVALFIFLTFYFLKSNTEIRRYQAQLAGSVKMAALGDMAGGMAHEINNPLAIIHQSAELLNELIDGEFDKTAAKKMTVRIINTIGRIALIIKSLRAFSKDADDDPFQSVRVNQILEQTIGICSEKFKFHGVRLIIDNPHPSLEIECRHVQISQVLLNLLNNSYDAIQAHSEKWVRIEIREHSSNVEISVTDSGGGIPILIQDQIFQPFFTTKEIGQGTGLGLSFSKGIIDAHNGKMAIDAESENTRFVISLPKKQNSKKSSLKIAA